MVVLVAGSEHKPIKVIRGIADDQITWTLVWRVIGEKPEPACAWFGKTFLHRTVLWREGRFNWVPLSEPVFINREIWAAPRIGAGHHGLCRSFRQSNSAQEAQQQQDRENQYHPSPFHSFLLIIINTILHNLTNL
jgi:hypothetical protein